MKSTIQAPAIELSMPNSEAPEPNTAPPTAESKPRVSAAGPKIAGSNVATKPKPPSTQSKSTGAKTSAKPIAASPPSKSAGATDATNPKRDPLRPKSVVGQHEAEAHRARADDTNLGGGHENVDNQASIAVPDLTSLRIFAEVYEDVQKQRIATANRVSHGEVPAQYMEGTIDLLERAENEAAKVMRKCYRATVPPRIRAWQEDTIGIGDKLLARLLGVIGHPVHTTVYEWQGEGADRELVEVGQMDRSVSQLWSYCGHGDPTRKRRTGMSAQEAAAMGNPRAKMLVHLMAECCMKQTGGVNKTTGEIREPSPYRAVYDEARMDYESRDWTDLHRHNAALRKTAKAILRDLWIEAGGGHSTTVAHCDRAPCRLESVTPSAHPGPTPTVVARGAS